MRRDRIDRVQWPICLLEFGFRKTYERAADQSVVINGIVEFIGGGGWVEIERTLGRLLSIVRAYAGCISPWI